MIEVHDISKILQPTIVLASAACMLKFKPIILQWIYTNNMIKEKVVLYGS